MKKKTILSIMDSLEKINDSVIRNIDIGVQVSMETLVDCQDYAIAVGNEIEQQYGDAGEQAVHLLEAYCENLYQMSSKSEDFVSCRKLGKKIQKQLVQIRNHIKYDLPDDKKEIVFLPYKASMWDSLESVWRAADADPACNAYVIPIPYFDKNPDGSFREEHYEGDLYPKDVPITRYDEYDLEACHPDVIYIHNPYDECNHVTSVHPYFYSKNLRNFTDKLVYIPYFVLGEIDPDNQAAIDGMKHFCFTPGTIYADQVIVQSENMRQIYINEYIKAAKEMGLGGEHVDRKFLEKKFLGTGSPKIDKVLNTKKEDLEIPAEWLRIIEKPDGSWKKIVFYNISVSTLLRYEEKALCKIESVFGIFQDNRNEVALLWRPHPLIQATIESMRPQLWEKYKRIRDRYIEEGWGIYDDSVDLDRAVVISDAYYGSQSSVVELCRKKGMPVMVQDVETLSRQDYLLPMSNGIVYEERLWFVGLNDNGIYSMNLETFEAELICRIPWEDVSHKKMQYGKIVRYENKILLVPWFATRIAVFDMQEKKLRYIEYAVEKCGSGNCFYDGVLIDHKIFLVPTSSEKIVCVNMITETIDYVSESLIDKLSLPEGKRAFAIGGTSLIGKYILFTMMFNNLIVKYDTETNEITTDAMDDLEDGGTGILSNSNGFWIIHRKKNEILYCDTKMKQIIALNVFPEDFVGNTLWNFYHGFVFDEDLFLLPRHSNVCLRASVRKQKIERIAIGENKYSGDDYWKDNKFPSIFRVGNTLMITDHKGMFYSLSRDGKIDVNKVDISCGEKKGAQFERMEYEENNYYDNLECFLQSV